MSARRNEQTIALQSVVCPRCESGPGVNCVTVSGGSPRLHSSRVNPLYEAWRNGYTDGRADGLRVPR